ncbi:MAG TPA: hypothetical protein VHW24_22440, partial [Bryobacteraceae bacterium]|nr:hypothetical protein [Bryobacteraceae bacterium]
MAKERWDVRLGSMNRRKMLGTGAGLFGGVTGIAFGQEKRAAGKAPAAVTSPNLNPPVVTVQGGKLRG